MPSLTTGSHSIAIACLPSGVYRAISAATVLSHLLQTFPGLRLGLMNIGIHLGDVIVSMPNTTSGGVVQYVYGKTLSDGSFQLTGLLNKPPQFLLTAMSQMRSNRIIGDKYFTAQTGLLTDEPHIHYGTIASGNQVMKYAMKQDAIAGQMDILCFEIDAAGLVDQLPCLVIRGICDYCDSHKHKSSQGSAALTAAKRSARDKEERARIKDTVNGPPTKVTICGLGGVGKTQIALELAYRIREKHSASVFWVPCTSYEAVEQEFSSIAQILGLHSAYLEQDEANRWLWIFRNDSMDMWVQGSFADSSLSLTYYLPLKDSGHILFTTRNRKVAVHLASSDVRGTLKKSLIKKDLLDSTTFLPLAIIQASTYIKKNLIWISDYIELLQEQEADVIELRSEISETKAVFPNDDDPNRKLWRDYLLHILSLLRERDFDWEQYRELIEEVGLCFGMDERYNETGFFFEKLLLTQKLTHGDTNNKTLSCMVELAWAYRGQGRWIEAEELEMRVLETRKRILGPEHHETLSFMANLAFTWSNLGKWQDAEALREQQVVEARKRYYGLEHPRTLRIMVNLVSTCRKRSKSNEAEELEKICA
ncbi:hypothetical protein BJY00DRAFT_298425 [Aspergillus carlsbadensis]|nr:hypothetical protein BJY00DRAFT_298425 [Aspergillus carlsbadensis]